MLSRRLPQDLYSGGDSEPRRGSTVAVTTIAAALFSRISRISIALLVVFPSPREGRQEPLQSFILDLALRFRCSPDRPLGPWFSWYFPSP